MGEEKCTLREKILGTRMRKGPRLTLVWGLEWLIRPWLHDVVQQHAVLLDTEQSFTEIRFDDWHFLLTNWHFLLMGNGVFTCYSNWPVQISLSRAKLIKNFEFSAVVFPVNGDIKIILRDRGPLRHCGARGSLPLYPPLDGPGHILPACPKNWLGTLRHILISTSRIIFSLSTIGCSRTYQIVGAAIVGGLNLSMAGRSAAATCWPCRRWSTAPPVAAWYHQHSLRSRRFVGGCDAGGLGRRWSIAGQIDRCLSLFAFAVCVLSPSRRDAR